MNDLPVSPSLNQRLVAWAADWNAHWGELIPGWDQSEMGPRWIREGHALVADLQRELGPAWDVTSDFDMYVDGAR